ncbi:AMP binding protein [Lentinula edodes]|nr:AMP binding protein [Lentinula edodes]
MAPRIFRSALPDEPIVQRSIFTHQFPEPPVYPPEYPAYVDAQTGVTLNRGHIKDLALTFACALRNEKHAKRGDTIMMFSPNSICWPVVVFGAVAAGLRCTFANTAYTADELAYQYTDSHAYLICTTRANLKIVQRMLTSETVGVRLKEDAERRTILLPDDFNWVPGVKKTDAKKHIPGLTAFEDLLKLGRLDREEQFQGVDAEQETVFLCYSSGTTGKPKGVETTHQNLTTVLDIVHSGFPILSPTGDRMLAVLPFYHIYGLVKLLLFPFICGVSTIVMPHFDPLAFCESIQRYKVTITLIVPPVLVVIARHDCVKQYDMSSLRIMFSGAAPLGGELVKAVKSRLRPTNQPPLHIVQGYGLTETSPTTHLLPILPAPQWGNITEESKYGSIGFLLPNLEARLVVDDKDGHAQTDDEVIDAPEGERGELWIRGRSIMKGYLNNSAANTNAFFPYSSSPPSDPTPGSRWFKTGDIGIVDKDGFFWIVDRKKELIKYKGFQVPPAELESVLLTHPKVADAGVIGVESAKESTELPRAYIVPADSSIVSSDRAAELSREVQDWVKTKVSRHKFLRGGVVVVPVIPKSASGKILRRYLKEQAMKELAGRDPADIHAVEKVRTKL